MKKKKSKIDYSVGSFGQKRAKQRIYVKMIEIPQINIEQNLKLLRDEERSPG